jgi:hypothetical protein
MYRTVFMGSKVPLRKALMTILGVFVMAVSLQAQPVFTPSEPDAGVPLPNPPTSVDPFATDKSTLPAPVYNPPAPASHADLVMPGDQSGLPQPASNPPVDSSIYPASNPAPYPSSNPNIEPISRAPGTIGIPSGRPTGPVVVPIKAVDVQVEMKTVKPAIPPKVDESKLEVATITPSKQFMKHLAFEAVSSSSDWRKRWYASDFGNVSIFTVPTQSLDLPRGIILPWRKDNQGAPEVVLHAVIHMPNLKRVSPSSLQAPIGSVTVDIKQYLSFYYRDFSPGETLAAGASSHTTYHVKQGDVPYYSGVIMKRDGWAVPASTYYSASPYSTEPHNAGSSSSTSEGSASFTTTRTEGETGWMASASPYYITRTDESGTVTILDVKEGRGAWNARVGAGGLMIRNFVEGGLAAARTELVRTFRDEEIQWFLRGNSDVLFYLRPQ